MPLQHNNLTAKPVTYRYCRKKETQNFPLQIVILVFTDRYLAQFKQLYMVSVKSGNYFAYNEQHHVFS